MIWAIILYRWKQGVGWTTFCECFREKKEDGLQAWRSTRDLSDLRDYQQAG